MVEWRPTAGQVALIEVTDSDDCLTGLVLGGDDTALLGTVVIDLGASPTPAAPACEVVVSFFSPEALHRVDGTLRSRDRGTVVDLTIHGVERVQRRAAPRLAMTVPIVLSNFDDPDPAGGFASVSGESVNISEGGCRVVVNRRFPAGCDPTVTLHLTPTDTVVALAATLEELPLPDDCYEYRLVFTDQEDHHRELLHEFLATA